MIRLRLASAFAFATLNLLAAVPAVAQVQQPAGSPAQRERVGALDFLNGEWRGTATTTMPGHSTALTQTERVGPLLGGSVKLIEGRGYAADGSTQFNAFAVLSWDERAGKYLFRSYANGYTGEYLFELTENGFRWEMPAGPNAVIKYVAVVENGTWHEVGDYVAEGQPPRRFIELRLTRVGDTGWPGAGAVSPQ
ncbi:MAG: DUF1579 domain-containing protein [Brevundimonas sp.]|nr:DUF1579 domain-containing protein [Brevundimonas sp.]